MIDYLAINTGTIYVRMVFTHYLQNGLVLWLNVPVYFMALRHSLYEKADNLDQPIKGHEGMQSIVFTYSLIGSVRTLL